MFIVAQVGYALTVLPPCTIDGLHGHPHSAEHMIVIKGATRFSWLTVDGMYHESDGCANQQAIKKCALSDSKLCPKCHPDSYVDTVFIPEGADPI